MSVASEFTLFSGGAQGAEAEFGRLAESFGVQEVNYSFEGHKIERTRGLRMLTQEELMRKDVSLTYVSKLLDRNSATGRSSAWFFAPSCIRLTPGLRSS